ncbi:FHA domain-containing protein [Kineococcus sp. SYSU DK004]|uniref:FHA domain-containing protein n=1 Tax=Kineococcus sp. SYSU DK004 TaxID=3383125 RepID=UPI003D7D547E
MSTGQTSGEPAGDGRPQRVPDPPEERPTDSTMSFSGLVVPEVHEVPEGGLSADDAAAIDALPVGSALLIVRRGPSSGSRFLLDADRTTAGRHESSDIFLDDVTVSRKHAEFVRALDPRTGPGFRVRDVGSLNGTYVNRERIDDAVLRTGDEVQVGKYRMVYHASPHAGPQAAPAAGEQGPA